MADVCDPDSLAAFALQTQDYFSRPVDLLIANAGVQTDPMKPWEISPAQLERILHVNVVGVLNTVSAFVSGPSGMLAAGQRAQRREMKDTPSYFGRIIVMSSGLGRSTSPTLTAYSCSKWAVESYTKGITFSLPLPRPPASF